MGRCINEVFARAGIETSMGTKLHATFIDAGLEPPNMTTDANIGAGAEWVSRFTATFGAGLLRSILPSILEQGVATEEELDLDTFDERYTAEVVGQSSVVQWIPFVGAWSRKPSRTPHPD